MTWVAVVMREGMVVDREARRGVADAPYSLGLLALRIGRLTDDTVRALTTPPEVLLLDATARDHPRGAGLALHLGAELGLPTLGITHRLLLARGEWSKDHRGDTSPLQLGDIRSAAGSVRVPGSDRWLCTPGGWSISLGSHRRTLGEGNPSVRLRDAVSGAHPLLMGLIRVRGPSAARVAIGLMASGLALLSPVAAAEPDADCRSGYVSLTFDDGPAGPTTQLLGILRRAQVPATFFMVGQRVAARPGVARRAERHGFLVANHSWAHADMTRQTSSEVARALRATDAALRRAGTHPSRLMRPPYGALDHAARDAVRAAGFVPVLWTVDSRDWESNTARQIATRILDGLRPNATNIVLQHDGVRRSPTSVAAVPLVIEGAHRRGYCFVALDERGRPGFPTPTASVSVASAREGRPAVAMVRLSKPPGRTTSVVLRTLSRSATVGDDVGRVARRVTIPAGQLALRVPISLRQDGTDESPEQFEVTIGQPRGVRVGAGSALVSIRDIDPPPRIVGIDTTVTEPTDGRITVGVRLELSQVSGRPIRLVIVTQPGTADGTDFAPIRLEVIVPPGQPHVDVPVEVLADAMVEPAETLTVGVVRGRHVRIGPPATVTVVPPSPPS